jgi:hypothetical protein
LNVHRITGVSQAGIHIAEPLVPKSPFEVDVAIEKLKRHKSPGVDQIRPDSIQA